MNENVNALKSSIKDIDKQIEVIDAKIKKYDIQDSNNLPVKLKEKLVNYQKRKDKLIKIRESKEEAIAAALLNIDKEQINQFIDCLPRFLKYKVNLLNTDKWSLQNSAGNLFIECKLFDCIIRVFKNELSIKGSLVNKSKIIALLEENDSLIISEAEYNFYKYNYFSIVPIIESMLSEKYEQLADNEYAKYLDTKYKLGYIYQYLTKKHNKYLGDTIPIAAIENMNF